MLLSKPFQLQSTKSSFIFLIEDKYHIVWKILGRDILSEMRVQYYVARWKTYGRLITHGSITCGRFISQGFISCRISTV